MKKTINTICAAVAIVGVFAAVCVTDGSNHEIAVRLVGILAFMGGLVGWSQTSKPEKQ